ncbi:heavy metal-binding domain-containing protein [Actinocorallia aurea]|nr:heavy metal-binding domain-containing protein [Actinocorallia herbida]
MIVSTMNDIPGYEVTEVIGDVFGLTVMVRSGLSSIEAGIKTFLGGEPQGLARELHDFRLQARERLIAAAKAKGAGAILAVRYESNDLRDTGTEICAYGTAVKIRPL